MRAVVGLLLLVPCDAFVARDADMSADLDFDADMSCDAPPMSFSDFVRTHKRTYVPGSDEYKMREAIFYGSSDGVRDHNCGGQGRAEGWKKTVNRFSDWTQAELMSLYGYSVEAEAASRARAAQRPAALRFDSERERFGLMGSEDEEEVPSEADLPDAPETWSWGHLDAIQSSSDQGHCGSCWAVAGEAIMRAHSEIIGRPRKFSVDTLISCTPNPKHCGGTGGCHGATAALTYEYATNYGLPNREPEAEDIPMAYWGDVGDCPARWNPMNKSHASLVRETKYGHLLHLPAEHKPRVDGNRMALGGMKTMGMYGWLKVARNRLAPLKYALVNMGPLSVSIAVTSGWHQYDSGVMAGCGDNRVSVHGIVLFGYGKTRGGRLFWNLKNSWGNDWGEEGHIRLSRQSDEDEQANCGWNRSPSKGSGCDDGPSKVWVCGTCDILFDGAMPLFKDPSTLQL